MGFDYCFFKPSSRSKPKRDNGFIGHGSKEYLYTDYKRRLSKNQNKIAKKLLFLCLSGI
jgi:hypothetical protein